MTDVAIYAYRALRRDGTMEAGSVTAPDAANARASVVARGLLPIDVHLELTPKERKAAIRASDLAIGLRILSDLLESGLPLSRSLQAFDELAPSGWKEAVPHIRESIREGKSLATALASAPVAIPALVVGIVHAGEAGSGISHAMRRAAEAMEGVASTSAAVRSALVYPAVLAIAGLGSVGILVGVVLPKFAALLGDLSRTLPPTTRLLLGAITFSRQAFIPALLCLAVVMIVWTAWITTERGRVVWAEFLLDVPLLGIARRSTAGARWAFSLSALLDSGVALPEAMRHAARASGDPAIEHRVLEARDKISTGATIGAALEAVGAVSGTVTKLVRTGEETGRLTVMLAHAAKIEHEKAERIVRSSVRLIEPALVLFFAGMVAFVAAAMLQAVYSVRPVQ